MRKIVCLISLCLFVALSIALADDSKPKSRIIPVTDTKMIEAYNNAVVANAQAFQELEKRAEWQAWQKTQSRLQATTLYIYAELGVKPSDECTPATDKEGRLTGIECAGKKEAKAQP